MSKTSLRIMLLTVALVMVFAFSFATDVMIDNCDVVSNITTVANGYANFSTTPWSLTVEADASIKSEGAASFKIIQTNNCSTAVAANWNNGYVDHVLSSPVDISNMEWFSFDYRNDSSVAGLTLLVVLFDVNGQAARYWPTNIFGASSTFRTMALKISDFQKDTWTVSGKSIDLTKIVKIRYQYANSGWFPAGSFTYWIDNVRFNKNIGKAAEFSFINFNDLSTTATYDQISAMWQPVFAFGTSKMSGYDSSYKAVTSDQWPTGLSVVQDGGKNVLKMNYTHYNRWSTFGLQKTFATPVNLTGIKYMKVNYKGSTTFAQYMTSTGVPQVFSPINYFMMIDTAGRRVNGQIYGAPSTNGWYTFILPFQGGANNGISMVGSAYNSCWIMGSPTNAMINLSCISSVILGIYTGNGTMTNDTTALANTYNWVYPINTEMTFGEVVMGFETKPQPNTSGADKVYTVNYTPAPVIDGIANDSVWNQASDANNSSFVAHDNVNVAAVENPKFKVTYDNSNLYLLFQAPQNYLGLDFTPTSGDRDPVGTSFTGDDIELFIAPYGPTATNYYHITMFPDITNNRVILWDEANAGGSSTFNGSNDTAALTFANGTVTIEYAFPFAMLNKNQLGNLGKPQNADIWGVQVGFINRMVTGTSTTTEYVNWENDTIAGFAAGRPFGAFVFYNPALSFTDSTITVTLGQTVPIDMTGGLAPYNWSFSASSTVLTSAYGNINSATGSRIQFTATASGEVNLFCTDSDASPTTVQIHIKVVPTSAPLWTELE